MAAGKRSPGLRRPVDLVRKIAGGQGNEADARATIRGLQFRAVAAPGACRGGQGGRRPHGGNAPTRHGRPEAAAANHRPALGGWLSRPIGARSGNSLARAAAPLLLLASTIPQDSTRAALAKTLHKRLSDGPKALEAEGLTDRVVTDPGLLVLAKLLPRKELAALQGRPARAARRQIRRNDQRQQAEQDWCVATSKLVATWCKRFYGAERAGKRPRRRQPIRLARRRPRACPKVSHWVPTPE